MAGSKAVAAEDCERQRERNGSRKRDGIGFIVWDSRRRVVKRAKKGEKSASGGGFKTHGSVCLTQRIGRRRRLREIEISSSDGIPSLVLRPFV